MVDTNVDKLQYISDQLHLHMTVFALAAQTLRQQQQSLSWSIQDLVNGANGWAGTGSQNFQTAWPSFFHDTQESASALDDMTNALTTLKQRLDDGIQKMRSDKNGATTGAAVGAAAGADLGPIGAGSGAIFRAIVGAITGFVVGGVYEAIALKNDKTDIEHADSDIGAQLFHILGRIVSTLVSSGTVPINPPHPIGIGGGPRIGGLGGNGEPGNNGEPGGGNTGNTSNANTFEQIASSLDLSPSRRTTAIGNNPPITVTYNPGGGGGYTSSLVFELNSGIHITIYQDSWNGTTTIPDFDGQPVQVGPYNLHLTVGNTGRWFFQYTGGRW